MKTIAMYLPQFHRIPENDEWWGEGYTEWEAAKKAKPYFPEHYQPHVPLNEFYYNLLDKETMKWQSEMMHEYGIDGMCFYHYYFGKGRLLLEKPAENLLEWRDIDMPFCFCWDSASWGRSWSALGVKTWIAKDIIVDDGQHKNDECFLVKQEFGGEDEWERHFFYLRPFFEDSRYIRLDGQPVFLIYNVANIWCLDKMVEKWNVLARECGYAGICVISVCSEHNSATYNLSMEPRMSRQKSGSRELHVDYQKTVNDIIVDAYLSKGNTIFCGFPAYDDTPRRGDGALVYYNSIPDRFYKLMKYLYYIGEFRGNEFTFVNAWNEWGEGNHLEPDERYGYGYLEALRKAKEDACSMSETEKRQLFELIDEKRKYLVERNESGNGTLRFKAISRTLNKWMTLREQGKSICDYLADNSIRSVAIYGIGMLGKRLFAEFIDKGMQVEYGIDQKSVSVPGLKVYKSEEVDKHVRIIIVTVIDEYNEIHDRITKLGIADEVVSLEHIIEYALEKS